MAKRAVYTVITGGYDTLKEPFIVSEGWDYICFTDDPGLSSDIWEIRLISAESQQEEPDKQRLQRKIKILPHIYLPEYRYTIYIDGSTVQMMDFDMLLRETNYLGGILLKKHGRRNCVYEEIAACVKLDKDSRPKLMVQMSYYREMYKHPINNGLYETGVLVRENCEEVNNVSDLWYAELRKHSVRDQISLPIALRLAQYKPLVVEYTTVQKYISIKAHSRSHSKKPHIWYLQPYAVDKNIGREYNYQCELIPDNDWICILDHDTMFLNPETKKQVEEIVLTQGGSWDLLGCVTNRIGSTHQCAYGIFSDDPDIKEHYKTAQALHSANYGEIKHTMKGIAGFFMLMPKKTWERLKFTENTISFDTDFSRRLLQKGGRIGVMQGVYVFHYYRFHAEDPKQYKDHLL